MGQPPTLVYLTNKYRTFKPSYGYIFGNVITNIHVPASESEVLYRSWEVVPKAPLWSVIGSVPTTTNYTTTVLNDHCPHGEIIILPATNVAGYHFTDMQFERVNTLTNLLTDTNNLANPGGALPGQAGGLGAGGAAITNFVGVMEDEVWQSTNHAYLAYPITLQTNAMLLGGIDPVLELARKAQAHHIPSVISSSYESSLGLIQLAHLAAAIDANTPVGLDTVDAFQEDLLKPGFFSEKGALSLEALEPRQTGLQDNQLEIIFER